MTPKRCAANGRAEAAEAGDHLVEDEQDAMLVADRAEALEIAPGRGQDAGRSSHRLDDHRGDLAGAALGDDAQEVVRQLGAMLGLTAREGVALGIVGVAEVIDLGQQGSEGGAVIGDPADRKAAEIDPVIAALAPDQPHALGLAAGDVIGAGDLQRGVSGLASGIDEEDVAYAVGEDACQRLRRLERERVTHLERRGVVELDHRGRNRVGDLTAPVAGVDAPQARGAIQHLAAVGREIMHTLGAGEQARRGLELAVGRKRHPPCGQIGVAFPHGGKSASAGAVRLGGVRRGCRKEKGRPEDRPFVFLGEAGA